MKNYNFVIILILFFSLGCQNVESDWERVKKVNTIKEYTDFIYNSEQSEYKDSAKLLRFDLIEKDLWSKFYEYSEVTSVKTEIVKFLEDLGYVEGEGYQMRSYLFLNYSGIVHLVTYARRIKADTTLVNNERRLDVLNKPVKVSGFLLDEFKPGIEDSILIFNLNNVKSQIDSLIENDVPVNDTLQVLFECKRVIDERKENKKMKQIFIKGIESND